jgi:hypothetical protein
MSFGELILIGSVVLVTVAWFWSLIDCAIRQHQRDMDKLVWVAIIISTYIFGSLAYLWVWRKRTRPMGSPSTTTA